MIYSDTQHPLLVTDSSSLLLEQVICQIPSSADIPRGRDRHQDDSYHHLAGRVDKGGGTASS